MTKSSKRTIFTSGGFGLLQMVSESNPKHVLAWTLAPKGGGL